MDGLRFLQFFCHFDCMMMLLLCYQHEVFFSLCVSGDDSCLLQLLSTNDEDRVHEVTSKQRITILGFERRRIYEMTE